MVLLIALSGLIIFNSQEKNATNYEKNTVAIDYQQHYEKPSTKNNTKKNTQQIPDKEIIEPIAKTIFDDDPYVNSIIIGQKYQHCTDILSYMKINNAEISIYTKFKTSKPEYYKRTMEYCQNIHKQHPEFNLDQVQNSNNYPPTSYLGRFLSDLEFAFSQLTSDLNSVKIALKNTDPNLMLTPNYGLSYSVIVPDLRLILKSQQNDYALIIYEYGIVGITVISIFFLFNIFPLQPFLLS